jgi:hypothetical protein
MIDARNRNFFHGIFVLSVLGMVGSLHSAPAFADSYQRVVHYECEQAQEKMYVKLYTLYEDIKVPEQDYLFLSLSKKPHGLSCRLSTTHIVEIRAMASIDEPSNDNLQVLIDSKQEGALSVDDPFDLPSENYSSSMSVALNANGIITISQIETYNLNNH